mgnify:CR=1 FL=1
MADTDKVIVLVRGTLYDPEPTLWQGTWEADQLEDAQKALQALRAKFFGVEVELVWRERGSAELMEEKYRDWASDPNLFD